MEHKGILDILKEGYGFIRGNNPDDDIYVSNGLVKKYQLRTGDCIVCKAEDGKGKFKALTEVITVNGYLPDKCYKRKRYEDLTPTYPVQRIQLSGTDSMNLVNIVSPIGKGQRALIVSPPKAGKTTMMKSIAKCIAKDYTEMDIIILLIDERPEEVTDISDALMPISNRIEIKSSTFDESAANHIKIAEQTIEYAKRKVEMGKDVVILLDSITRLTRAYNLVCQPSGKTLSGGIDPVSLTFPKKFFGAARNLKEGGSLTIIATALTETGSKMDDVVYEEFKGTGNMELTLSRALQEKRIFPAIDIQKSGTRREDLLLTPKEMKMATAIRCSSKPISCLYSCN